MRSWQSKQWLLLLLCLIIGAFFYWLKQEEPVEIPDQGQPIGQSVSSEKRQVFSKTFGKSLQSKFKDASVSIQGEAGTTLKITWQAVNKPFAVGMANNKDVITDLREMGFKRLIMTDGDKTTWEVDLRN
jgi:hypothetical protein